MPSRDPLLRIQDILDAITKIQRYTQGMTLEIFSAAQPIAFVAFVAFVRAFNCTPLQCGHRSRHRPDQGHSSLVTRHSSLQPAHPRRKHE